jgi:hypothetical protein
VHQILSTALKLLVTTSIFSLVPKVTHLPASLATYLSSTSNGSGVPPSDAPKLLTRQIKASIYHLQTMILRALFSRFNDAGEFATQVNRAVELIVTFALELVRDASRLFARYSHDIDTSVVVEDWQVEEYERRVENLVVANWVDETFESFISGLSTEKIKGKERSRTASISEGSFMPARDDRADFCSDSDAGKLFTL